MKKWFGINSFLFATILLPSCATFSGDYYRVVDPAIPLTNGRLAVVCRDNRFIAQRLSGLLVKEITRHGFIVTPLREMAEKIPRYPSGLPDFFEASDVDDPAVLGDKGEYAVKKVREMLGVDSMLFIRIKKYGEISGRFHSMYYMSVEAKIVVSPGNRVHGHSDFFISRRVWGTPREEDYDRLVNDVASSMVEKIFSAGESK